ncbi:MAG: mercury resistance system transport protein MerF [SAR324 cluster bacterium]|nr:mercury resistance system transport protein MerF [SAR324 cluster bacterium]MCZ6645413.1 mercury resistance system transport protein MerF [SAR324 cluster bacterium]
MKFGAWGTVIAALYCFTLILMVALPAIGVGMLVAYLDWVLFPALAAFLALLGYGLYRMNYNGKAARNAGN